MLNELLQEVDAFDHEVMQRRSDAATDEARAEVAQWECSERDRLRAQCAAIHAAVTSLQNLLA